MPLPTSNPGALITTVGGIHACRIALYVNFIAALQVRAAARQGEWWWETRARKFMSSGPNKAKDGEYFEYFELENYYRPESSGVTRTFQTAVAKVYQSTGCARRGQRAVGDPSTTGLCVYV